MAKKERESKSWRKRTEDEPDEEIRVCDKSMKKGESRGTSVDSLKREMKRG